MKLLEKYPFSTVLYEIFFKALGKATPKGLGENSFYASWIEGRLEAFLLYPLRIFVGNSGVGFPVYARTARTRHSMRRALVYARRDMDSTSSVCRVSSRRRTLPPCPPTAAGRATWPACHHLHLHV
jgi:hypothetical protein